MFYSKASFIALVFSEYNIIESAYIFQTNLSKQWIENIRATKQNFHLLMEESKLKFQDLQNTKSTPNSTVSPNTIHQSLPNLSLPLMELPLLKLNYSNNRTTDIGNLPEVESNAYKTVEQPRRNSRTDRKNFGRYFTADGTSTHDTTLSSSPIKQTSSSSSAIIKRMSWNSERTAEKNDSSLTTNSFRSVHSSSGVSSTGSFIFSTDEDLSVTTTSSSIPSVVPLIEHEELNENNSLSTAIIQIDQRTKQSLGKGEQNLNEDLIKNNSRFPTQISSSNAKTHTQNDQLTIGMIKKC